MRGLFFKTAPDHSNPTDADGDNRYDVTVTVDDNNSGNSEAMADSSLPAGKSSRTYGIAVLPDLTPPELQSAAVNHSTLTLTYDRELDSTSVPDGSAFTMSKRHIRVSAVSISGMVVTLTLDIPIERRDGIRVSYTRPTGAGAMPLRSVTGGEVASFTNQSVKNNSPSYLCPSQRHPGTFWSGCMKIVSCLNNPDCEDFEPISQPTFAWGGYIDNPGTMMSALWSMPMAMTPAPSPATARPIKSLR